VAASVVCLAWVGASLCTTGLTAGPTKGLATGLAAAQTAGQPALARPMPDRPAPSVTARRLAANPLITTRSSPSLGDDINGPTVIRVPSWIQRPLGRYYMYFAHHMGAYIRLAYADALTGPWKIYEPGVVQVRETAFYRPQPDPPENLEDFYTHVASPEVAVDDVKHRLILWFHGWYTNAERWPVGEAAARRWAQQHQYGQFTQVGDSANGTDFTIHPAITRTSYLRVFEHDNTLVGMARLGVLLRTADPLAPFEAGPNPFRDSPFANRVRHVAVTRRGDTLFVFFTAIRDAPERVMVSTIDLRGDWQTWRVSEAAELLRPEAPYECAELPNAPSEAGDVKGPVRQLRDPGLYEEDGHTYLFYSYCGEQGIAAAELTFGPTPAADRKD
jgi:hypothetical protein